MSIVLRVLGAVVLGTLLAVLPTAGYADCAEVGPGRDADVDPTLWPLGYRCDYGGGVELTLAASVPGTLAAIVFAGGILEVARRRPERAEARGALAGLLITALAAAALYVFDLQLACLALLCLAPLVAFVTDHLRCPRHLRSPARSAVAAIPISVCSSIGAVVFVFWGETESAAGIVLGPLAGAVAGLFPAWLLDPPRRRVAG